MRSVNVMVTGEPTELESRLPKGNGIQWKVIPVLDYEPLSIAPTLLKQYASDFFDWIFFNSARCVQYWHSQAPQINPNVKVACMGKQTAHAATETGYTVDYFPKTPGTEGFLSELNLGDTPRRILIPASQIGRTEVAHTLQAQGHPITQVALYATQPKTKLELTSTDLQSTDLFLLTSPSSARAVLQSTQLPPHLKLACLGEFTSTYLTEQGLKHAILPNADYANIGALL